MMGQVGISPPPPVVPDEVLGLLRLVADPDLASKLLAQRAEWAKAHEANEKLVAKIKQKGKLDQLVAGAEHRALEVDRALAKAKADAEGIVSGAKLEALALREDARIAADDAKADRATAKREAIDAADALEAANIMRTEVRAELDGVKADRADLRAWKAAAQAKADELDKALAALRGNI